MKGICNYCGNTIDVEDKHEFRCYLCGGNVRKKRPDEYSLYGMCKPLRVGRNIKKIVDALVKEGKIKPVKMSHHAKDDIYTPEHLEIIRVYTEENRSDKSKEMIKT